MAGEAEIIAGITDAPSLDGLSDLQVVDQVMDAAAAAARGTPVVPDAGTELDEGDDQTVEETIAAAAAEEAAAPKKDDVEPEVAAESEETPAPKAGDKVDIEADVEDDGSGLTVTSLKNQIAKSADLKAVMDKDPAFRKQVFYTARRAERANQYDELFQTPALAAEVKAAAEDTYQTRQLFDGTDSKKFLQKLLYDSLEKNEDGSLRLDEVNRPISTGAYERHMAAYRTNVYESVEKVARNLTAQGKVVDGISGEDVAEALRIVKAVIGDDGKGGATATPQVQEEGLSPQIVAELTRLRKLESDTNSAQSQTIADFRTSTESAAHEALATDTKNLLAKRLPQGAAYSDYIKNVIVNDTVAEIEKVAKANLAHQDVLTRALRSAPRNADGVKKLVSIQQSFAKELIPRILAKVMTQATPGVVKQNSTTHRTIQNQGDRREVATSGGVSTPARPDVKQVAKTAVANAQKSGKVLSDMELLDVVMASQK